MPLQTFKRSSRYLFIRSHLRLHQVAPLVRCLRPLYRLQSRPSTALAVSNRFVLIETRSAVCYFCRFECSTQLCVMGVVCISDNKELISYLSCLVFVHERRQSEFCGFTHLSVGHLLQHNTELINFHRFYELRCLHKYTCSEH